MNKYYQVTLAHAVGNENGKPTKGQVGDQTGKEVRFQKWYARSKGWSDILRCKNIALRNLMADNAEIITKANVGYAQDNRYSLYDYLKDKGFDAKKIGEKKLDCDCSSMQTVNANYAGFPIQRDTYTGNMKSRYSATKGFKIYSSAKYTDKPDNLVRGDLVLGPGHVAIVVNTIWHLETTIKQSTSRNRAADVKALQARLNELKNYGLVIDGDWGQKTEKAVRDFQTANYLTSDGIVGKNTAIALGFLFGC